MYQCQRRLGTVRLADCDRAVERHHRCGGDRKQLVVQGDDLRPIRVLDSRGVRVHGVDRGLQLIWSWLVAPQAPTDDPLSLLDGRPIPA